MHPNLLRDLPADFAHGIIPHIAWQDPFEHFSLRFATWMNKRFRLFQKPMGRHELRTLLGDKFYYHAHILTGLGNAGERLFEN